MIRCFLLLAAFASVASAADPATAKRDRDAAAVLALEMELAKPKAKLKSYADAYATAIADNVPMIAYPSSVSHPSCPPGAVCGNTEGKQILIGYPKGDDIIIVERLPADASDEAILKAFRKAKARGGPVAEERDPFFINVESCKSDADSYASADRYPSSAFTDIALKFGEEIAVAIGSLKRFRDTQSAPRCCDWGIAGDAEVIWPEFRAIALRADALCGHDGIIQISAPPCLDGKCPVPAAVPATAPNCACTACGASCPCAASFPQAMAGPGPVTRTVAGPIQRTRGFVGRFFFPWRR